MEKKRLDFLDIAKGIGIILVLYSHSCGFPIFGNAVVAFYMPLFFFVSGYVYKSGRTPIENIKRKLKQLLIPYAGFTLLLYAEHVALGLLKNELTQDSLIRPLLGALYSRACLYADMSGENVEFLLLSNGPMWFITAMAASSVFFYVFVDNFLNDSRVRGWIIFALGLLTIAFTYCPYLLPWSLDTAPACVSFMLIGALAGKEAYYNEWEKKKFLPVILIVLSLGYCIIMEISNPVNLSLRDYGYDGMHGALRYVVMALVGVWLFLGICKCIEKFRWTKVFILVGKHTYTIMALHILLFKYLTKVYYIFKMPFEFNRGNIWYWIYWTVLFAVVIVICIVFDKILAWIKSKCKK